MKKLLLVLLVLLSLNVLSQNEEIETKGMWCSSYLAYKTTDDGPVYEYTLHAILSHFIKPKSDSMEVFMIRVVENDDGFENIFLIIEAKSIELKGKYKDHYKFACTDPLTDIEYLVIASPEFKKGEPFFLYLEEIETGHRYLFKFFKLKQFD